MKSKKKYILPVGILFEDGGWKDNWKGADNSTNSVLGILGGGVSDIISTTADLATVDTSQKKQEVEAQMEAMNNSTQIDATSSDALLEEWSNNKEFSTDYEQDDYYLGPTAKEGIAGIAKTTFQGAKTGAKYGGLWGGIIGGVAGLASGSIGYGVGRKKGKDFAEETVDNLTETADKANIMKATNMFNAANNIGTNNNRLAMASMRAFGGPLEGYGADWTNGITTINNGGTHSENPFGGVPMGIAEDGQPNLVEEGEAIWKNYVFSDRIKVPKEIAKKLGISKKDATFADAVKQAKKESDERPNDPISKKGLAWAMNSLMQAQEFLKQQEQMDALGSTFADGGTIHINKNKRGTFTAAATKHGMGVQAFASHVLANKDKFSPTIVKKANFARNASKWSHALGGQLFAFGGDKDKSIIKEDELETPLLKLDFSTPSTNNRTIGESLLPNGAIELDNSSTTPIENYLTWGNTDPIYNTTYEDAHPKTINGPKEKGNSSWLNGVEASLRYAPIVGSLLGTGLALADKPDYTTANKLRETASNLAGNFRHISPRFIGDYMAYNPMDKMFYANELGQQAAATRRGIQNLSNSNRGAAMAGLLGADMNAQIALGKMYREAEESNLAQRQKVTEFNRGTNQFNSELGLKADMANAATDQAKAAFLLDPETKALLLEQAERDAIKKNRGEALSGLFDNLGGVGQEAAARNAIATNGAFNYLLDRLGRVGYKSQGKAKGGYITIKKKGRK